MHDISQISILEYLKNVELLRISMILSKNLKHESQRILS